MWKDAPTLKELGYPFVFDSPFGIAGPKGMESAIVKTLADAFKKAMAEPAVIAALKKYDMFPRFLDTADYQKAMTDLVRDEGKALADLGLAKKD